MKAASGTLASPGLTISATGLLAFVAGALSTTTVNIVGSLYVSEIIALITIIKVGVPNMLRRTAHETVIIASLTLILLGLVIADISNATAPNDLLRGWANPLFAIINILFFLYLINRNERTILFWLAGSALAHIVIVDEIQLSELLSGGNVFKSRVVPVLEPVLLIVAFQIARFGKNANILLFSITSLTFIMLGARSSGLCFLATAAVLSMLRLKRGAQRYIFVGTLVGIGYILYVAYVGYILDKGQISNSFNQLTRADNPYNPIDLIKQGRSELFVALAAIRESPLVGHGSWAEDAYGQFAQLLALIKGWTNVYYSDWIVSHSVVLTAWMWGGVIAFSGALIMYFSSARRAIAVIPHLDRWRPILIYLLVEISWHFVFSPFGHIRTSFPLFIGVTLVLSQRYLPDRKRP